MSKPTQNPRPIFFGNKGPQKSDIFLDTSKTTKPRDIHIQVRRTLLYRVPRNNAMFHNKIQPPMERFHFFSRPNPKIWVAALLVLPQETWIVCRQDMCCVCRQDICCVCSQDICCVSRQEICSLPRHPLGIADTGAAASRPPLCGQ